MREIWFRGKRKDNGEWVEGYYLELDKTTYCFKEDYKNNPDNTQHYIVHEEITDWGLPNKYVWTDVIPETVGQYTGFLDKNGIKIFENDVVFAYGGEAYGGCYENSITVIVKYDYDTLEMLGNVPNYEIIGNIFDNPELLKGDAE